MIAFADLVQETSSSATSPFSVAASGAWSSGFQNVANALNDGDQAYFHLYDSAGNTMTALMTYSASAHTLTTSAVLTSSAGGTSAPTFSGTVTVALGRVVNWSQPSESGLQQCGGIVDQQAASRFQQPRFFDA